MAASSSLASLASSAAAAMASIRSAASAAVALEKKPVIGCWTLALAPGRRQGGAGVVPGRAAILCAGPRMAPEMIFY